MPEASFYRGRSRAARRRAACLSGSGAGGGRRRLAAGSRAADDFGVNLSSGSELFDFLFEPFTLSAEGCDGGYGGPEGNPAAGGKRLGLKLAEVFHEFHYAPGGGKDRWRNGKDFVRGGEKVSGGVSTGRGVSEGVGSP